MDRLSPSQRSRVMARVRGKDTQPELRVRKLAHSMGLRFRLHRRDLPGTPDLVFPKYHLAVFIHGCFWHQHQNCKRATVPATQIEFWRTKLARNVARDSKAISELKAQGWRVEVIWECETKPPALLRERIDQIFAQIGIKNRSTEKVA
jgi:DNA mismatch endonuclease (patch repair protein)